MKIFLIICNNFVKVLMDILFEVTLKFSSKINQFKNKYQTLFYVHTLSTFFNKLFINKSIV